jgi:hypothetical protein
MERKKSTGTQCPSRGFDGSVERFVVIVGDFLAGVARIFAVNSATNGQMGTRSGFSLRIAVMQRFKRSW